MEYAITFALAALNVGIWTLRITATSRGRRTIGSALAIADATVYLAVVSRIVTSVGAPLHVVAYATGIGLGTFVALSLDRRLNAGEAPMPIPESEEAAGSGSRSEAPPVSPGSAAPAWEAAVRIDA